MIPLDIDDATVLRRTLEELEARIPLLTDAARPITIVPDGADLEAITLKLNEAIVTINLIIDSMDKR